MRGLTCFFILLSLSMSFAEVCRAGAKEGTDKAVIARLNGNHTFAFNGIPKKKGWGKDLVYIVDSNSADTRIMGPLGGIPLVDIWNKDGGIAVFNTTTFQEPFSVKLSYHDGGVSIKAKGGTNIEVFKHKGDYYEAIREFALRMKEKGIYVKPAPNWAFDAIWETYGFEEDFNTDTIKDMVPLLKQLGIKTLSIDSGWYGKGRGEDIEFNTGDFNINPDVIGNEKDFIDLIDHLHGEGFRVRVWWVPGCSREGNLSLAE